MSEIELLRREVESLKEVVLGQRIIPKQGETGA